MKLSEEWQTIPGYEGHYEISSLGRVISLKYGKRKLLKIQWNGFYKHVTLSKNNKLHTFTVHSLVAAIFLGPRPSANLHCCHKDGNVEDNSVSNLYYGTPHDNALDTIRHGKHKPPRGSKNGMALLTDDEVNTIRQRALDEAPVGPHGKRSNVAATALIQIASDYKMSARQIRDIVRGACWTHENSH
jgi:hypothetical protein